MSASSKSLEIGGWKLEMKVIFILILLSCFCPLFSSQAAMPVATDSRIRTFVYGENEVFRLSTVYGYQSNVEFSTDEEVLTISIGDPTAWQVTPAGRRLFVKAMQENAHTNMTVVTNKRTYQFDLTASPKPEDEVVYVIRFYYPEKDFDRPSQILSSSAVAQTTRDPVSSAYYNFNYTLTGPESFAPLKVFDDGKHTYFQFPNNNAIIPQIALVGDNNQETDLVYRVVGGYVAVDEVGRQFLLRQGQGRVNVYNENIPGTSVAAPNRKF